MISLYIIADDSSTIATLLELKKSQETLKEEIKSKIILENNSTTDSEKERLKQEISVLDWNFNTIHTEAFIALIVIIMQLIHMLFIKIFPILTQANRSFLYAL